MDLTSIAADLWAYYLSLPGWAQYALPVLGLLGIIAWSSRPPARQSDAGLLPKVPTFKELPPCKLPKIGAGKR